MAAHTLTHIASSWQATSIVHMNYNDVDDDDDAVILKDAIKWAARRCRVCVRVFVTMRLHWAYVHSQTHTHTHIYSASVYFKLKHSK